MRNLVEAWSKVFNTAEALACLLLANPVEVVALACEDHAWRPHLLALLGPCNVRGEPLTLDNLFESVKLMKTPSWRYRTEVQGLLETACLRVTRGKHRTLEGVRVWWIECLPPPPVGLQYHLCVRCICSVAPCAHNRFTPTTP